MPKYDASNGHMCFGMAIDQLKLGRTLARTAWQGKGSISLPPEGLPIMRALRVLGTNMPWAPLPEDILAEDWVEVIDPS